jgi:hypothetical protein
MSDSVNLETKLGLNEPTARHQTFRERRKHYEVFPDLGALGADLR